MEKFRYGVKRFRFINFVVLGELFNILKIWVFDYKIENVEIFFI